MREEEETRSRAPHCAFRSVRDLPHALGGCLAPDATRIAAVGRLRGAARR